MAVDADLFLEGGHVELQLYPGERRERVADDAPEMPDFDPGSTTWLYYDGPGLERGQYQFLAIEIANIADFTDEDMAVVESLSLPHVNCAAQDLFDTSIADVLRCARSTHQERLARGTGRVWSPSRGVTGVTRSRASAP